MALDKAFENLTIGDTSTVKQIDGRDILQVQGLNLTGDTPLDVVIFGEGNFTFSVALAALRGGWDGITATKYFDYGPKQSLSKAKLINIEYMLKLTCKIVDDQKLERIKNVLKVERSPVWRLNIDATCIPGDLDVRGKVVWFQCPWIPRSQGGTSTAKLVKDFIEHMAKKQGRNDYLLVGIANRSDYVEKYDLASLLDDDNKVLEQPYQLLGYDTTLVNDILHYGYKHEGCKEIHYYILPYHITLIFRRT